MKTAIELAKQAYTAYGTVTDFKNYQGLPMPEWDALPEKIKEAWQAAATSLVPTPEIGGEANWREAFDERQLKEIMFSWIYNRDFKHGTDGHNGKIIIAQMANLLDANKAKALPHDIG